MWTTDEHRLEHFCRLGLLAVAILHWIFFALMIRSDVEALSNQAPPVVSNFASALFNLLQLS